MKTKIKRHSRSVISVVLAVCMLISCMTVGLIATDAAKVSENSAVAANVKDMEAVGAKISDSDPVAAKADSETISADGDWYIVGNVAGSSNWSERDAVKLSAVTGGYSISIRLEKDKDFRLRHNSADYGANSSSDSDRKVSNSTSNHTLKASTSETFIWTGTTGTYTVTINSDGTKISFDGSVPGGGSSGGGGAGVDTGTSFPESWHDTSSNSTATIYYDNSITQWSSVKFRIGRHWAYGSDAQGYTFYDMTKVTGTDNIYACTIGFGKYTSFYFTNGGTDGWATGDIETVSNKGFTAYTSPKGFDLGSSTYFFIGQSATVGTVSAPQRVLCYGAAGGYGESTASDYTTYRKSVKNNSVSNGTVDVNWTNPSGTAQTIAEGATTANMLIGTKLTVTMTPDDNYAASNATVTYAGNASSVIIPAGGSTFTSGNTNTEVTGSFINIEPKHAVTFNASPSAGGTITPASGTEVGEVTSTNITATPNAAYTFSGWSFGEGITGASTSNATTTITTKSTGDYTVTANFTKKPTHKVTVVSNNNALGTATASVTEAYEGQSVKLTATENSGTFSKWTVTSGTMSTVNDKTTNPLTFTMGNEDLTITANFTEYVGQSNYYYNGYTGYNAANGDKASGYFAQRMSEGKIGGQKYAYYYVSGRTGDQTFTVSYGNVDYTNQTLYWTRPSSDSYNTAHPWSNNGKQYAMFYSNDEVVIQDWTEMTQGSAVTGGTRFTTTIPDSARYARIKDQYNSNQTVLIDLNTERNGGNNGFYISGHNGTDYTVTGWKEGSSTIGDVYEYFNGTDNGIYTSDFNTTGFSNHNYNHKFNDSWTVTHTLTKPKDAGSGYYILLFYPKTKYTYNDVEKTIGNSPVVVWSNELPDNGDTIRVYAKDGAIRDGLNTFANIADTTVYKADGTTSAGATSYDSGSGQTYEVYKAQRGETIVVKTTIANTTCTGATDTYRERYYVRGFCVNGEVPQTLSHNNEGVYTLTYTVPEDYESKYIEITPIYFLKDTTNYPVVTFRATDFPKNQHNWGNVPYCYPFYGNLSDKDNAFGAYPGQPLVFYKGQYSMQVPVKSTSPFSAAGVNTNVAGITMSNGYYDSIHKMIMGYGDNNTSADHVQTYDYGDFWKIFNEKKPVDNIVFDFKYRTVKHNLIDDTTGDGIAASTLTGTYTNGFELLKNFHGRNVDLFGTPLSGDAADPSETPAVYVVSIGGINDNVSGVENIAGYYATEWRVYAPNDKTSVSTTYKKMSAGSKSSIPPEVLVLNDDDDASFNTSTYPSAVDKEGKRYKITDWKALYQALENYRGLPVYISYEAADAQEGAEDYKTGTHGATRNDGRWLYSKNGESITSNIKIQYSNDNGTTWVDNETTPKTGLSAYFTNTDVYGTQTYATTIDPDKTFNFEAKTTNGQYKFVGWYLDDSNKTLITDDNAGSTERSGSYTFVAKFMLVTEGQLILSHSVDTGTIGGTNYDGAGTVTIAAVVKDRDGATVKTFAPTTSDITLDNKIIKSDNTDYTVDVTLTATRGNNSALGTTILATPEDQESKFFDYGDFTVSADGKTRTYSFTFSVGDLYSGTTQTYMNLIYHSYFKNYVFKYTVNYEFTGRDGGKKIYNRAGTLTAPQAEAYVYKDTVTSGGSEIDMRFLRKEFFESLAPYESNFRQSLTWNFTNKQFTDGTNYVYNCNAHFEAIQNDSNEKVNVTFVLPYAHTNGVATLNNGVGTAETSTNYALINDGENDNRVSFGTIPTLTGGRTNGIYTEEEKSHWIAAPAKLNDGNFFRYWSIKTTDGNVEVARCYFPGFNFLAYDNYVIEAIYGSAASSISASGINTSATYLSTTRNQWNALNASQEAVPDVLKGDTTNAADVLFNDFVLSYNYNGADIYLNGSDASDIEELGVVVERVKELDKNSDNSYDTRISSYTSLEENATNVDTAINTQVDQNGKATYKNGSLQYYKQTIGKNQLDNKNRIQFYEAFFNASGWNSIKQKPQTGYTYKKYVYRAYSYMKLSNGAIVKSETPAYFTMYDVATASYSSN